MRRIVILLTAITAANSTWAQVSPTAPMLLNSNGTTDDENDFRPYIETDGNGVIVAAWHSRDDISFDDDILFTRSDDNGATWSDPTPLNTNAATDTGDDREVTLATDRTGNWVAAWSSTDLLGDSIGGDQDIVAANSTDNGETWSDPVPVNSRASMDFGTDSKPSVATDGAGNWITVWQSNDSASTLGTDADIFSSRSGDNGANWSTFVPVNDAAGDNAPDLQPVVATDTFGRWICAWAAVGDVDGSGNDSDIVFSVSLDLADTWTSTALLVGAAAGNGRSDSEVSLATNRAGIWVAAWISAENYLGAGDDEDIFYARSDTSGVLWDGPFLADSNAAADSSFSGDERPAVTTDEAGNWVITWSSQENLDEELGIDEDTFIIVSTDEAVTWSETRVLNINASVDTRSDNEPSVATDFDGNWIAIWESNNDIENIGNTDLDIHYANFELGLNFDVNISGQLTMTNAMPFTCAVVEASLQGGSEVITAVTDLRGEYFLANIPNGIYDLRMLSPDFGEFGAGEVNVVNNSVSEVNFEITESAADNELLGTVVDTATMEPLVGVFVEALVSDAVVASTYTCATGDYSLIFPNNLKGAITADIRFSLDNYDTKTITNVDIAPGQNTLDESLDKSVEFPSALSGFITDAQTESDPIAGARVTVRGPANLSTTTDVGGAFTFDALLNGTYIITASATGFESKSVLRLIASSELEIAEIELFMVGALDPSDLNEDGSVNSVDIQLVINTVLGVGGGFDADVNDDGNENSVDIQLVINTVLGI